MSSIDVFAVKEYLLQFQNQFTHVLTHADSSATLITDTWDRPEGGGGDTRAISDGKYIEKAGVNLSHVWGKSLPASASATRPEIAGKPFQAIGVSTIVHPTNPFAPTCHANIRLFVAGEDKNPTWWFGGGFDLTPYYGFDEDCVHWHQHAKEACQALGPDAYPRFKKWADDYFYLKHRKEPRGIGGIFFDDINQPDFNICFQFLKDVGQHFIQAYEPILNQRKNTPYSQRERDFQLYRRGRYVEFNLVYDRGTLFGLQSNGRTESILISLPPKVEWHYNWNPEPNSAEAKLTEHFLVPQDWENTLISLS